MIVPPDAPSWGRWFVFCDDSVSVSTHGQAEVRGLIIAVRAI